jgi:hypothetical protein
MGSEGSDADDFDSYRRLILAELQKLNRECEAQSEWKRQHELADKDNAKQIALDIQALQLKAEEKGRSAGEKAGATWGAVVSAAIMAVAYGIVYIVQHLP